MLRCCSQKRCCLSTILTAKHKLWYKLHAVHLGWCTITDVSGTRIPIMGMWMTAGRIGCHSKHLCQTKRTASFEPFFMGPPEVIESFGSWHTGHGLFCLLFLLSDAFHTYRHMYCKSNDKQTTVCLSSKLQPVCNQWSVLSSFINTGGSHKSQQELWWIAVIAHSAVFTEVHLICEGQFNIEMIPTLKSRHWYVHEY